MDRQVIVAGKSKEGIPILMTPKQMERAKRNERIVETYNRLMSVEGQIKLNVLKYISDNEKICYAMVFRIVNDAIGIVDKNRKKQKSNES